MHVIATLIHRGRRAVPLALCLGLALAASAAHAGPGPAKAPQVKAASLPTWDEVAAVYQGFEGGSRETTSYRDTFVLKKNCSSYDDGPTADKGRYADYYGAFGSIPVHDGYEQPSVFTMSFATVAAAKKAFKAQQAWIKGCDGKTAHKAMETNSYDKVASPRLGDQRIAYRHTMVLEQTGDDPWHLNELVFWIRDGRFLLDVQVRVDVAGATPAEAPLVTLAEIALDRLP
jgi:hypothetical protein